MDEPRYLQVSAIMDLSRTVLLIGPMYCGKSTVGRLLAGMLAVPFIDLDRLVEARVGPLVPFFEREGEAAFRSLEREMLEQVLDGPSAVVATGGGTPCEGDNMTRMKASGTVVWLDAGLDALLARIARSGNDRPLLLGLTGDALRHRMADLLARRAPFYGQAHVRVQADDPPEVVAARARDLLVQSR